MYYNIPGQTKELSAPDVAPDPTGFDVEFEKKIVDVVEAVDPHESSYC